MAQLGIARQTNLSGKTTDIEELVRVLRSLWAAVESGAPERRRALRREIAQTLKQLESRIGDQLNQTVPRLPTTGNLFEGYESGPQSRKKKVEPVPRFPEPSLRVYDKELADHALRLFPHIGQIKDVDELRAYLTEKTRFNSLASRRRAANYLINRFFPGEAINLDLPAFAAATEGNAALGEALFYLTCRTEKIVSMVAEQVVFPSLPEGGPLRSRILDYVQTQFPRSKSVHDIAQAIVRTYDRFGIGTANRARLNVTLREGSLVAFAYVLHLEFPEPGMHSFELLFDGPMQKWLLWDKQWIVRQLYHLREAGMLAKVSEIDRMRQFTTKYSLADALKPIVALAKEALS